MHCTKSTTVLPLPLFSTNSEKKILINDIELCFHLIIYEQTKKHTPYFPFSFYLGILISQSSSYFISLEKEAFKRSILFG